MVLLRRVIGDALRARRQGQHRTLREVSTAANVSLGYLSEIERGQKEASSELLAAICDALGARLSEVLREVSDTLALAEQMDGVLDPGRGRARSGRCRRTPVAPSTAARCRLRPGARPPRRYAVAGRHRRQGLGLRPPGLAAQGHAARHARATATSARRLTADAVLVGRELVGSDPWLSPSPGVTRWRGAATMETGA